MSNNVDLAFEVRCKVEQVKAVMRAEGYMMGALIQSNMPVSAEAQTLEVLENIKLTFLTDIEKLAEQVEEINKV